MNQHFLQMITILIAGFYQVQLQNHTQKEGGGSLMIAHFVSTDYGWLQSPNGAQFASVLFRAGKNWEGYFSNNDILAQFKMAIKLVKMHFSGEDHIFVYDNATTHLKQHAGALSASKTTKGP